MERKKESNNKKIKYSKVEGTVLWPRAETFHKSWDLSKGREEPGCSQTETTPACPANVMETLIRGSHVPSPLVECGTIPFGYSGTEQAAEARSHCPRFSTPVLEAVSCPTGTSRDGHGQVWPEQLCLLRRWPPSHRGC